MNDTNSNSLLKPATRPIKLFLFLVPIAMGAGYYAGNEIATGEVALHKAESLERNTAQGKVVRVKKDVPPDVVIDAGLLEEQTVFANRIEPDLVRSLNEVVGKKSKFGLNKGQLVVNEDLK